VLRFRQRALAPDACNELLARLPPIVPACPTALRIQLGFHHWLGPTASLLDKPGERLILFSLASRASYRSASMRCTPNENSRRDRLREALHSPDVLHAHVGLAPRDIQVTGLLVQRMTDREIASALGISAHSVVCWPETLNGSIGARRSGRIVPIVRG
jgi:hypothetical protein